MSAASRAARAAGALLAAALAAAAGGGCGEPRESATRTVPEPVRPPERPRGAVVATVDASLVETAIVSGDTRVPLAGAIAFAATNDGVERHALAVDGPAGTARTRVLRPGERAVFTVRLPAGTYKWYCPLDDFERLGMVGRVRVAE